AERVEQEQFRRRQIPAEGLLAELLRQSLHPLRRGRVEERLAQGRDLAAEWVARAAAVALGERAVRVAARGRAVCAIWGRLRCPAVTGSCDGHEPTPLPSRRLRDVRIMMIPRGPRRRR